MLGDGLGERIKLCSGIIDEVTPGCGLRAVLGISVRIIAFSCVEEQ
jgi:hypothetical protein